MQTKEESVKIKLTKKQLYDVNRLIHYYICNHKKSKDMIEEMQKSGEYKRLISIKYKIQRLINFRKLKNKITNEIKNLKG